MSLIIEKNELNKFIEALPELISDEVYFISLSARNKYLSDSERVKYSLTRTEMFSRHVVRSKEQFPFVLNKMWVELQSKKTRTQMPIPLKALVVYINIHPSSMIKAWYGFENKMNTELMGLIQAIRGGKTGNYKYIRMAERKFMNEIQKATSRKLYIDIDCDTDDPRVFDYMESYYKECGYKYIKVYTKSECHYLIDKATLPQKNDLWTVIELGNKMALESISGDIGKNSEVIFNKNSMIPLPGTLQGNTLVRAEYV